MTPIRVLHVVTSLEPGGMENGVCNIAQSLVPEGIETSVACLERSGPFAARLPRPDRVEILGKKGGFSPKAVFALWRASRRLRPHVIHSHNLGPLLYSALATLWGRTCAILHGEHSQLAPWELEPRRIQQRRRFYRACRAVHTVSHAQREELVRLGFEPNQITAIPNGVDTDRFIPRDSVASRRALGLPEHAEIAGVVSRFGPYKGHAKTLEAFTSVARTRPDLHLVFIGTGGSEESSIRQLAKEHSASNRIHFLGFRPDVEICYPAIDLLLIPSANEGMSNVALEAMACGVPILANRGSGNEAMITDGKEGWLDDLSVVSTLAERWNLALSNRELLKSAGTGARTRMMNQFSMAQMIQAYGDLYRRLAA